MKLLFIKIALNFLAILIVEAFVIGGFVYATEGKPDSFERGLIFLTSLMAAGCTFAAMGESISDFVNAEYKK